MKKTMIDRTGNDQINQFSGDISNRLPPQNTQPDNGQVQDAPGTLIMHKDNYESIEG